MSKNISNRRRAFADVVSVDAWHGDFAEGRRVDFHADVVFGTARVGGEIDSPIRFRLSVKSAEVVLVISDFEPVKVDPKSVFRGSRERHGQVTETVEQSSQASAAGKFGASISSRAVDGKASL